MRKISGVIVPTMDRLFDSKAMQYGGVGIYLEKMSVFPSSLSFFIKQERLFPQGYFFEEKIYYI